MIIGIGSDLIDIRRVSKTLKRFPGKFEERCFTKTEREKSDKRRNRAESYAKRYAAKEACSKALGTGFRRGVFWSDMGVVNIDFLEVKIAKWILAIDFSCQNTLE